MRISYWSSDVFSSDLRLGAKVITAKSGAKSVDVEYEVNGEKKKESFDKLIVAVGRRPNTDGLNAKEIGVTIDERGFVKVDAHNKTNVPGVYAIGDVIGGARSEEHTSELQSLMRISYAVFCLKKKNSIT